MSIAFNPEQSGRVKSIATARPIPWYIYASIIGSVSIVVGLIWDISWHLSVGRDGLFSAPHLAIYLGGVLGGIGGGYQMFKTTFAGTPEEKKRSVWFWGFRAPLGALFAVWGALAMLTSAPFDDWWHNSYGLDVEILSPPHSLLALGLIMVQMGAILTLLSYQNYLENSPSSASNTRTLKMVRVLFLAAVGMVLAILNMLFWEYLGRNDMHRSNFYRISGIIFPLFLVAAGRASQLKWATTYAALFYLGIYCFMNWILPLFPATPRLGPIYAEVTHFVPLEFPFLLFVPAIGMDLIRQRRGDRNGWVNVLLLGLTFFFVFWAAQWFFAEFLVSPAARNWFFFTDAVAYYWNPNWEGRFALYTDRSQALFLQGMAWALLFTLISTRLGYWWGNWMRKIER